MLRKVSDSTVRVTETTFKVILSFAFLTRTSAVTSAFPNSSRSCFPLCDTEVIFCCFPSCVMYAQYETAAGSR